MVEIKGIIWSESTHEFYAAVYVNGAFHDAGSLEHCVKRAKQIAEKQATVG